MVASDLRATISALMAKPHELQIRVRYAETDQMGVVHHASYLIYMEEGRTALMRQLERQRVGAIVTEQALPLVFWGDGVESVSISELRLENLCADCVHVIEFLHQ